MLSTSPEGLRQLSTMTISTFAAACGVPGMAAGGRHLAARGAPRAKLPGTSSADSEPAAAAASSLTVLCAETAPARIDAAAVKNTASARRKARRHPWGFASVDESTL